MSEQFTEVAEAFSRTAEKYDQFAEDHPNLSRMRAKVYAHLLQHLRPGSRILELNAGTGSDAVYLAQQGFKVHATDIAPGMLRRLAEKVERLGLWDRVSYQECSFMELERVEGGPFDAVFSNLGGLNCASDLRQVASGVSSLLQAGGMVTWVVMPPICPWELALAFSGDFHYAFRRLSRRGTLAHLEGLYFPIHYFTPQRVMAALGPRFTPLIVEGLSIFAPPAESKNLALQRPRLYRSLCWLDDRLSRLPPFRGWGDFFIITLRYEGE